jgi:hypothetical protein
MEAMISILGQVLIEVVPKATGQVILKRFGHCDPSERAMKTVGGAFWLAVIVVIVLSIRAILPYV